jgi:small subunit ribosomal protein MRP21
MAMLPEIISWDINEFRSSNKLAKPVPLEMRNLRPSTGRTIEKYGNVDVARAFQLLDMACNRNGVSRDLFRQRFHERPGLKRKRLRSERWRRMFKLGFRATVSRVSELRKQGW